MAPTPLYSAIVFDVESGDDDNVVSISWTTMQIRMKRQGTKMRPILEHGDVKHRFVTESVQTLREDSKHYNLDKFRRECSSSDCVLMKSWDRIMDELEEDLAESAWYIMISHSVDNDALRIAHTNDLYSKHKGRFHRSPLDYPGEFSDRELWNNVSFVCTQMIIKDRAPSFKDALATSYIGQDFSYRLRSGANTVPKKFNGGVNEMLSLKLVHILKHKFGFSGQSHTAYQDVLDLIVVLKDIFVTDGIDAFPSSNYYARGPKATIGIR